MLTQQDRIDITDLINRHGHLVDAGDLDRMAELFTPDAVYDVTALGHGTLRGPEQLRAAALALGDANPVGHHVTNIVITAVDAGSARVRSKGIGVGADGTAGSVRYDDLVTRGPDGWRISHRAVTARRAPLGADGPREVLRRWRRATVEQSVEAMTELYAADVVYEFPFAFHGVPTRFDGRDAIMAWTAEGWRSGALRYHDYRGTAVHDTGDPDTIVVEQEAIGTSAATGPVTLPHIVVLTAKHARITHVRDYVNVLAAAAALGHDIGPAAR